MMPAEMIPGGRVGSAAVRPTASSHPKAISLRAGLLPVRIAAGFRVEHSRLSR